MSMTLFEQLVAISEEFLGPAARRFVSRQITFHLGKQPEDVAVDDMPELTQWTRVTFALLTERKDLQEAYAAKMKELEESYRDTHSNSRR